MLYDKGLTTGNKKGLQRQITTLQVNKNIKLNEIEKLTLAMLQFNDFIQNHLETFFFR